MNFENRNEKQLYFNQIKGIVSEINEGEIFCSITLTVGHETSRFVNIVFKTSVLEEIKSKIVIGNKVCVKFYPSSYHKFEKWKTLNHLLSVEKIESDL